MEPDVFEKSVADQLFVLKLVTAHVDCMALCSVLIGTLWIQPEEVKYSTMSRSHLWGKMDGAAVMLENVKNQLV